MNTRNIACEVYLEGLQVPFNSVNITEVMGQIPEATINFPVTAHITSLLPKTICQVFFSEFDPYAKEGKDAYNMVQIFQGEYCKFAFSGDFDKRSIQASFRGITQNMVNALVVPIDTAIPSIVAEKATYVIVTETGVKTKRTDLLTDKNIFSQFSEIKGPLLPSIVLKSLLESYSKSAYFSAIYKLFKMPDQISYLEPKEKTSIFYKMIKDMSVRNLQDKLGTYITQTSSLMSLFQQLLAEICFEMQEYAAGTSAGKSIFIKPDTTFFEPIKCNTVFDSDISALQFSRDYDQEPTRAIRNTSMINLPGSTSMDKLLMSVVVPTGVALSTAATIDSKGLDILGFTAEERLRGVISANLGNSTLVKDYLMAAAADCSVLPDGIQPGMMNFFSEIGKKGSAPLAMTKELQNKISSESKKYLVSQLHVALATRAWLRKRQENRVCNIASPYNPYRLVGFTGAIITKELPTIVGVLHSVSSQISADGAASQSLTFTHCMFYDETIPTTSLDNLINQDLVDLAPPWFSDFTGDNIDWFYEQITGYKTMALRWVYSGDSKSVGEYQICPTVRDAIRITKKELQFVGDDDTYKKYTYNHTKRKLYPKTAALKVYEGDFRSIDNETKGSAQNIPTGGNSPFILERAKRVYQIFKDNMDPVAVEKAKYLELL